MCLGVFCICPHVTKGCVVNSLYREGHQTIERKKDRQTYRQAGRWDDGCGRQLSGGKTHQILRYGLFCLHNKVEVPPVLLGVGSLR